MPPSLSLFQVYFKSISWQSEPFIILDRISNFHIPQSPLLRREPSHWFPQALESLCSSLEDEDAEMSPLPVFHESLNSPKRLSRALGSQWEVDGLGGARGRKVSSKTDKDASGPWEGREPAPGRARPEGTSYRVTPGRLNPGQWVLQPRSCTLCKAREGWNHLPSRRTWAWRERSEINTTDWKLEVLPPFSSFRAAYNPKGGGGSPNNH